jgi:uncharacterized protein (TIGR03000 family)
MYSLILLSALSTGADVTPSPAPATAAPVVSGCCGATLSGCCGYSSCYGSCYGSCHGSCHGGLFSGRGCHGLFSHHSSCHGCHGYSSGCCGYSSGCCGGYSCSGWGSSYGSTWGPPIGMPPYTLHGYNQGGGYGYGTPVIWGGVNVVPSQMTSPPSIPASGGGSDTKPADKATVPVPNDAKKNDDTKKSNGMGANLKFHMPADTKLYIDGRLIPVGGTERAFSTPALAVGQKFYYDVKAELILNGAPVVQEMRVIVESGANIDESFTKLFAAEQGKPTVVAEK